MNKPLPLSDLEMYDLVLLAYPEKFSEDDEHENWNDVMDFIDNISGFEDIADFVGRLVMLTMPMQGGKDKRFVHCLGKSKINPDSVSMVACVKRDATRVLDQ